MSVPTSLMSPGNITSANVSLVLGVTNLFPVPQQIQDFSSDEMFEAAAMEMLQVMIGADGRTSAGYTPALVPFDITLMAASPSVAFFDAWGMMQKAQSTAMPGFGSIFAPSLGVAYQLFGVWLKTYPPIASAGRTFKPRKYGLVISQALPTPIIGF